MNKLNMYSKPLLCVTTLLLTAVVAGCGGDGVSGLTTAATTLTQTGAVCTGTGCVNLGTAGNYAILANTGIATDAAASVITGNIATGPGVTSTAITGFALNLPAASPYSTSAQVSGKVYAFDYAPLRLPWLIPPPTKWAPPIPLPPRWQQLGVD